MSKTMVYDSRLKRDYYTLRDDNNTVDFYSYEWTEEWGCYAPDGRNQHSFKLNDSNFKSWNDLCNHLKKFGFLTLEEQRRMGTAR